MGRAVGRRNLARDDRRDRRLPLGVCRSRTTIAAIGISNQRETVLLWRRSTGETIGPCVTWQCRRSSDRVDALRTPAIEEAVESKTGLGLDPLFPAAKIGWLLDAYPEARSLARLDDLCAGTIDSWLLFRLTGGAVHATDASNASRTQLLDIHRQCWSNDLCALFDVPIVDPSQGRGFQTPASARRQARIDRSKAFRSIR